MDFVAEFGPLFFCGITAFQHVDNAIIACNLGFVCGGISVLTGLRLRSILSGQHAQDDCEGAILLSLFLWSLCLMIGFSIRFVRPEIASQWMVLSNRLPEDAGVASFSCGSTWEVRAG